MNHFRFRALLLSLALVFPMSVTFAQGVFPDVTDNHPFRGEIESLFQAGIVKGNPDGKYHPDRSVNRAEFLKLLYAATKRAPAAAKTPCFTDVTPGDWYTDVVCDAALKENQFVQGYGDHSFRPGNPVSRTEALKMTFTVFRLPAVDVSAADKDIIKFADTSVSAWYTRYISAAYRNGMLPIFGFGGARFYPDKDLSRGEAAAFIVAAMKASVLKPQAQESSSSAAATTGASDDSAPIREGSFPFSDTAQFTAKRPVAYTFSLTSPRTIVSVNVGTTGTMDSMVTCRLYLLEDSDFSSEYYLGVQDTNSCKLRVAARPGRYQLQIQPTVADVPYFVNATTGSTDGNDGFVDAVPFDLRGELPGSLDDVNDLADWYTFTISAERSGTLFFSSSPDRLSCIIYTPSSVDQYGFTGPECGTEYYYPAGTYTVGIGRKSGSDLSKRASYTLKWH